MPDYLTLGATGLARTREDLAQLRASLRGPSQASKSIG